MPKHRHKLLLLHQLFWLKSGLSFSWTNHRWSLVNTYSPITGYVVSVRRSIHSSDRDGALSRIVENTVGISLGVLFDRPWRLTSYSQGSIFPHSLNFAFKPFFEIVVSWTALILDLRTQRTEILNRNEFLGYGLSGKPARRYRRQRSRYLACFFNPQRRLIFIHIF